MSLVDWLVVAAYCVLVVAIGLLFRKRAGRGTGDYFVSGRKLTWWVAGTSMAATAWASDTPLLVTGYVRKHGIWFNWQWWSLAISTMLAVFFFSRLWRRAKVLTEVELAELRYSGPSAAFLRGFKAVYWGLLFNCYVTGAWPVNGLAKVMSVSAGWSKWNAVLFCVAVGMSYGVASGMWGIAVADLVEMVFMVAGALLLAWFAVNAVGGLDALVARVPPANAAMFPEAGGDVMNSPFWWIVGMLAVQWWAWKNTDGGGVLIQKMSACRDERHAVLATLWYNIVHNALRVWPWALVALASIVLVPTSSLPLTPGGKPDHEAAYPMLFALLPAGLKGLVIASFFAAFMSTVNTMANWGASYVVNDVYRRFLVRGREDRHYVRISRLATVLIMAGTVVSAYFTDSIGDAFTYVLQFTAGIGVVYLVRWFWWRVNAWSEIAAMAASIPAIFASSWVARKLGLAVTEYSSLYKLLFMVVATAVVWVPVTFLTKPADRERLKEFYRRVRPPAWGWGPIRREIGAEGAEKMGPILLLWIIGVVFIYAATFGIGQLLVGSRALGAAMCAVAAAALAVILRKVRDLPAPQSE